MINAKSSFSPRKKTRRRSWLTMPRLSTNSRTNRLSDFPLAKPLREQAALKLEFANGSRIVGIPEGADQIRSFHPWGLLMDEAAFQPEAGEAYDAAVPVCQKIIVVSSAGPGWFADFVNDIF